MEMSDPGLPPAPGPRCGEVPDLSGLATRSPGEDPAPQGLETHVRPRQGPSFGGTSMSHTIYVLTEDYSESYPVDGASSIAIFPTIKEAMEGIEQRTRADVDKEGIVGDLTFDDPPLEPNYRVGFSIEHPDHHPDQIWVDAMIEDDSHEASTYKGWVIYETECPG